MRDSRSFAKSFGEESTHLNSSLEVKSLSIENTDSSLGAEMAFCDDRV